MKSYRRRIILNNDGETLLSPKMEAPIGVEGLVEATIKPLMNTHIDSLFWALGTDVYLGFPQQRFSNIYSHDTKVGERWGDSSTRFESASCWRIYENTRRLIEEGNDPPKVIADYGHKAGKEVFLSLRMNDCHDGLPPKDHRWLSKMKIEHRDWLLGEIPSLP